MVRSVLVCGMYSFMYSLSAGNCEVIFGVWNVQLHGLSAGNRAVSLVCGMYSFIRSRSAGDCDVSFGL